MVVLALLGCGTSCEVGAPLDYSADTNWLCRPGLEGACPRSFPTRRIAVDGTVSDGVFEASDTNGLACFFVYPTVDLRLGAGLHHDTTDVEAPARWASVTASPFQDVCDVYVPVYRQARLGTYLTRNTDKQEQCFDSAFEDVEAAFDAFLALEPERPFALIGHSQGSFHLSRLVDERIEHDPTLAARLVAAYPIGAAIGTAAGSDTGGTFDTTVPCTTPNQTGCVVALRTFLADAPGPTEAPFLEGDQALCSDPSGTGRLSAFVLDAESPFADVEAPEGTHVAWEQAFTAQCDGTGENRVLRVAWARGDAAPVDLESSLLTGAQGTHVLDMQLVLEDLHTDLERRAVSPLAQ